MWMTALATKTATADNKMGSHNEVMLIMSILPVKDILVKDILATCLAV
jgi:hypothetical protein